MSNIAEYAYRAGFRGNDLVTAVAIALAESSGDAKAYNPEIAAGTREGFGSYGLWQIYRQAHPEFSNTDLFDPQENANAAFAVYSQAKRTFTPWSTYTGDGYLGKIQEAMKLSEGYTESA